MEVDSMKKIVLALALAMLYASSASAATTVTLTNVKGFNKTNKVTVTAVKNDLFNAWAAASAHEGGDKEYATTSAYGGLAYKTVNPGSTNGTAAPSAPATPTDSTKPDGFTEM